MNIDRKLLVLAAELARVDQQNKARLEIPEGSMRVGPGTDAVVWRVCPDYKAEL